MHSEDIRGHVRERDEVGRLEACSDEDFRQKTLAPTVDDSKQVYASAWITVVRFCCFPGLLFRSLGGVGGGVDNVQFAYIALYRLGIYRLWRVLSLKVLVFDGGGILCGSP